MHRPPHAQNMHLPPHAQSMHPLRGMHSRNVNPADVERAWCRLQLSDVFIQLEHRPQVHADEVELAPWAHGKRVASVLLEEHGAFPGDQLQLHVVLQLPEPLPDAVLVVQHDLQFVGQRDAARVRPDGEGPQVPGRVKHRQFQAEVDGAVVLHIPVQEARRQLPGEKQRVSGVTAKTSVNTTWTHSLLIRRQSTHTHTLAQFRFSACVKLAGLKGPQAMNGLVPHQGIVVVQGCEDTPVRHPRPCLPEVAASWPEQLLVRDVPQHIGVQRSGALSSLIGHLYVRVQDDTLQSNI